METELTISGCSERGPGEDRDKGKEIPRALSEGARLRH